MDRETGWRTASYKGTHVQVGRHMQRWKWKMTEKEFGITRACAVLPDFTDQSKHVNSAG